MMNKRTKALIYNFVGYAAFFIPVYFLTQAFTNLTGWWIPMTAFMVATLLAPKFQAVRTAEGEKLFMKWLFVKGVKNIG